MVPCFVSECRNGGAQSPSLGPPEGQTQKVLNVSSLTTSSHPCMGKHLGIESWNIPGWKGPPGTIQTNLWPFTAPKTHPGPEVIVQTLLELAQAQGLANIRHFHCKFIVEIWNWFWVKLEPSGQIGACVFPIPL